MSAPQPQSLEYAKDGRGRVPTWVALLAVSLLAFAGATFLALMPDLHNNNPFCVPWLIAAPFLTYFAVRQVPPRRSPLAAPIVWLVLAALWAVGGFAVYGHFTGIDPHVLARASNRCRGNVENIGQLMTGYASRHAGRYPDRLEDLLDDPDYELFGHGPEMFVAPFTADTPAPGPTTRDVAAQLAQGHCSYVYLGRGLTAGCAPYTVLLYEPLSNHRQNIKGIHVLYANGGVAFIPEKEARAFIAALEARHNPPR